MEQKEFNLKISGKALELLEKSMMIMKKVFIDKGECPESTINNYLSFLISIQLFELTNALIEEGYKDISLNNYFENDEQKNEFIFCLSNFIEVIEK